MGSRLAARQLRAEVFMTHPLYADDEVGRQTGELTPWVLDLASSLMVASRKTSSREERSEALERLYEVWPKVTRGMSRLEAVAPRSAEKGFSRDADMQDVVAVINERKVG